MRHKTRGNGTGTAFKRGSTWTAQVVIGWKVVAEDKPLVAITRSKGGFKTRDQALRFCQTLKEGPQRQPEAPTLEQYWNTYKDGKYTKLSPSKQTAYRIAWKKLADISKFRIDQLTVADLQQVVDEKSTSFYTARDMIYRPSSPCRPWMKRKKSPSARRNRRPSGSSTNPVISGRPSRC